MEEQVKQMLAALQRQRNSANDKVVDLEVASALKDVQIRTLQEDLTNANETINRLRTVLEQTMAAKNKYFELLDGLAKEEACVRIVLGDSGEFFAEHGRRRNVNRNEPNR